MDPVFDDLLDLDNGTISGAIFTDEKIYQEELEQVFARSWLFLAHDTMIPKAGDFLQQYMGEDPVVVVRQKDGSIAAFLNQCTHRGMRICRADKGNAKAFMCSFHGWGYDLSGNLTHVPHEDVAYPVGTLDKSQWGARRVPRITNYKGFIFGTGISRRRSSSTTSVTWRGTSTATSTATRAAWRPSPSTSGSSRRTGSSTPSSPRATCTTRRSRTPRPCRSCTATSSRRWAITSSTARGSTR